MKQNILNLVAGFLLTFAVIVFAAPMDSKMAPSADEHSVMTHAMQKGREKGAMPGMMAMMHPSLVATNDGGVIVLAGNTLSKYDKDLNEVKEVEIKVNASTMEHMGMVMPKMCPIPGMPDEGTVHEDKSSESVPQK